ncbi:MAG TPA: universal stress protein [Pirellulales bacterium]|nr:universal stress protein [Pirellulales bacterium]
MPDVKRILVGVDLLQAVQSGETRFSAPLEQAIKQAIWLGGKARAELTFFAAVELSAAEIQPLGDDPADIERRIEALGQSVLQELVDRAAKDGVAAKSQLTTGKGWVEITREVVRGGHDLAIVGTRGMGAIGRMLFGSTAMKLLQNCPCPVWVTRPDARPAPTNLLVASDFSEVSDSALRLAMRLAALAGANVHLLHVFNSPFARLSDAGLIEANLEETYHARDLKHAQRRLEEQLQRVSGGQPHARVKQEVVQGVGSPDAYILEFIKAHEIDLLVMGTMARGGIPGVFIGNTAERLVHQAGCSLLAVKPADFKCPI